MNDILLAMLILFAGIVPVGIALYYSKKLLNEAQSLSKLAQGLRIEVPVKVKDWMLGEEFTDHMKNVFNGMMGKQVSEVKKELLNEGQMQGLPPPVKGVLGKGIANYLSGYGLPKRQTALAIESLLSRPNKQQRQQQQQMIQQYAQSDPNYPVYENNY